MKVLFRGKEIDIDVLVNAPDDDPTEQAPWLVILNEGFDGLRIAVFADHASNAADWIREHQDRRLGLPGRFEEADGEDGRGFHVFDRVQAHRWDDDDKFVLCPVCDRSMDRDYIANAKVIESRGMEETAPPGICSDCLSALDEEISKAMAEYRKTDEYQSWVSFLSEQIADLFWERTEYAQAAGDTMAAMVEKGIVDWDPGDQMPQWVTSDLFRAVFARAHRDK